MTRPLAALSLLTLCSVLAARQGLAADALDQRIALNIADNTPLDVALIQWSAQAHMQVMMDTTTTGHEKTPAMRGTFRAADALAALLSGSGLAYKVSDATVTVAPAAKGADKSGSFRSADAQSSVNPAGAGEERGAPETSPTDTGGPTSVEKDKGSESTSERKPILLEEVVVTGTHIRGVPPTSPVITISQTDIESSGYQSAGDVIRSLPQSYGGGLNATVVGQTGANNPANYSGASTANIRGLGSDSTLTLVNGHRLAYSDGLTAVDISLIPVSAIERIEVLTDGASAIYGSDAVAGVVNFVLKSQFEGVEGSAAFGDSTQGGGQLQRYGLLAGHSWGSGNALVSYEHAHQTPVLAGDRSYPDPITGATYLLPGTSRDSIFVSANQAMTEDVNLFAQGLYTNRTSDAFIDGSFIVPDLTLMTRSAASQYGVTAGAKFGMARGWHGTVSGDVSDNNSRDPFQEELPGIAVPIQVQNFASGLRQVELLADGPLFTLESGAANLAVGAAYRRETFFEDQHQGAEVYRSINAERHVNSAFAELSVPLVAPADDRRGLNSLEFNLAGRWEDYSDVGSNTVPKVGLLYRPAHAVLLRASWGRSFHAPSLFDEASKTWVEVTPTADPLSPTGTSNLLFISAGNPHVRPERSTAATLNITYSPEWLQGGSLEATYFDIKYKDRIESVYDINPLPLTDPALAPFITRNPTAAQQAAYLALGPLVNNTGAPYDPATVAALFDGRVANVADQHIRGVDVIAKDRIPVGSGAITLAVNGTYLDIAQQLTSASPSQEITGTVFNPSRFRARGSAGWESGGGWGTTLFVNYVGSMSGDSIAPGTRIGAWTTVDWQAAYRLSSLGPPFGESRVMLSVQNLFDRDPPYLHDPAGLLPLHFDSTNASALGRFISLELVMSWK
ncbi:MAG TPA: TonB-dependent receptor [Steroidobacteraceae bacterium]|nr:TonB-dependent receptor [Steroidobacteraceae bacterium]